MLNYREALDHSTSRPTKIRQFCSLGYECITTVSLVFAIGFVTTAIAGSAETLILRAIVGSTMACGVWAYYTLCWTTSGQSLAQKSWGLKTVSSTGSRLTIKAASVRLVLSAVFNLTLIGPAILLINKHNQLPQDKLLNTRVILIEQNH
jgi:uncharacterized RDD family membrane protein YckC